jgi:hypothetical protein
MEVYEQKNKDKISELCTRQERIEVEAFVEKMKALKLPISSQEFGTVCMVSRFLFLTQR